MTLESQPAQAFSIRTAPGLAEAKSRIFVRRGGEQVPQGRIRQTPAGDVGHETRAGRRETRRVDATSHIIEN